LSIPFNKSGLIRYSYSVGRKFPNLFTDDLSECHVNVLSAIM
jgi:hypothetical protein